MEKWNSHISGRLPWCWGCHTTLAGRGNWREGMLVERERRDGSGKTLAFLMEGSSCLSCHNSLIFWTFYTQEITSVRKMPQFQKCWPWCGRAPECLSVMALQRTEPIGYTYEETDEKYCLTSGVWEVPWSASWRTKKAGGIIQSGSRGLRTRSTGVWGQEKMDVSA